MITLFFDCETGLISTAQPNLENKALQVVNLSDPIPSKLVANQLIALQSLLDNEQALAAQSIIQINLGP